MERWGITFPLDGVPLPAHREVLREAETLGYTDAWTSETDGPDAFAPCVLASAWTDKLRLGRKSQGCAECQNRLSFRPLKSAVLSTR